MHGRLICIALVLGLVPDRALVKAAESPGAPRAVLVGVNKYGAEAGLAELKYACSDAQNIARTLDSLDWNRENIQVLVMSDLPAAAVRQ
jgi:hypothetical protein